LPKLLHVLLLVYWLGADLGTFYASRFVADAALPGAARGVAARIMLGVDLAPRVTMPLMLASGVQLAQGPGALPGGAWLVAGTWLLCLGWLAVVLAIHHRGADAAGLVRFDLGFRVLLIAGLVAVALAVAMPGYVALKLLAFAATVACGLMIRMHLRPFGPAFARALRPTGEGGDAADNANADADANANATVARSIARCKPYVLAIWALLVLCAAAGLHLIP
jgi:hypothetical protein